MRNSTIAWLTVAAIVSSAAPAFAEGALEQARTLKEEADSLYAAEEYAEAAEIYREAYELVPDPILLGTESVALYLAGDCETSLVRVEEYATLEELPPQLRQVQVGCAIREAEAAIDAEQLDEASAALDRASTLPDATDRQSQRIDTLRRMIVDARATDQPDEPTSPGFNRRTLIGGSLLGVGAITAGVSVIPALKFRDHRETFDMLADEAGCVSDGRQYTSCEREADPARQTAAIDGMTKTKTATWLLLGSGLAVGTIGAILLLTPETENAQVLVGPSSVGVRVRF